ncbi:MAG: ATP-binding cassette domain-containing protein [Thermoanaerobacteraceae bacterium]|nr:ATP-binding cassette domain-containing protein [Thermoanaerobacteraceae bacterium]
MDNILEMRNIDFSYSDGTHALKGVSIGIERGKRTVVVGANGAGKSTMFLHLNGILRPKKGKILFNGEELIYKHAFLLKLRKSVGIVFQNPDVQLFSASVYQEISFGPMNLNLPRQVVIDRVESAMEATGTSDLKDKPTHFLSYGQKKRVSIADILAMESEVIIFDEPTAYLDPKHIDHVINIMEELNKKGKTILLSTHDVDLAYSIADYVYVMKKGTVLADGLPNEIFSNEDLLKEADLKKPLLLKVYDILKEKGIIKGDKLPKDLNDLSQCLNVINNENVKDIPVSCNS